MGKPDGKLSMVAYPMASQYGYPLVIDMMSGHLSYIAILRHIEFVDLPNLKMVSFQFPNCQFTRGYGKPMVKIGGTKT